MRGLATGALVVALAGAAAGHATPPAAIVAELNGATARSQWGVEGATRDERAPRLLVIRVGAGWYALPAAARRDQADAWHRRWRHSVPQGIVAVLDARSGAAAVDFGPQGRVTGVREAPAR